MHKPSFGVSLEGMPFIGLAALTTLTLALLGWPIPSLIALVLTFFILHFFRDPERVVPVGEGSVVSPADGKVLDVASRPDPVTRTPRARVSIFMNVFNVHVNRAPVQGTVTEIHYHGGRFFRANLDKADAANERNVLVLEDTQGQRWSMVQMSGLIARRIICWAEVQDTVRKGQRVGLIKFGSRVDLYLPEGYDIKVRPGDKVYAGQSILAVTKEHETIHV